MTTLLVAALVLLAPVLERRVAYETAGGDAAPIAGAHRTSYANSTVRRGDQETRKVPSDSVEVEARGCLKGRVFTGTGQPEEERTSKSPDVTGKSFRVTGEREVMDLVKKYNGQYVEILGIVRKAALDDQGIGMRVGRGGRVVIGAPGTDPTRMNTPSAAPSVAAMDVIAVRLLADRCPLR